MPNHRKKINFYIIPRLQSKPRRLFKFGIYCFHTNIFAWKRQTVTEIQNYERKCKKLSHFQQISIGYKGKI